MKIFIAVLVFLAVTVNAQSPYDGYFPNEFDKLRHVQQPYKSYEPYEVFITSRRPYASIATPSAFPSYKSLDIGSQAYNSYQTTTLRPYIPTGTTSAPSTISSYNAPYISPQPYRPLQESSVTRRPFIPNVTTQSSTTVPLYNAPYLPREPYKQYQTSPTSYRPYSPFLTNLDSITGPNYNTPYNVAQSYSPFQNPTANLRPYIPYASSNQQPYRVPSFVSPTANYYSGDASTVRSDNEINYDGSYNWFFETDNGIAAQAQGSSPRNNPNQISNDVQGSFSWTAPNGEVISYTYTADEYGYHPKSTVTGVRN